MGIGSFLKTMVNPVSAVAKVYDEAKRLPGTWESITSNVKDMANGDISANPFGSGQSGFDKAAGGDWLSQYPAARAVGRTVGSLFAGGYGGLAGSGAVAGAKALGPLGDKTDAVVSPGMASNIGALLNQGSSGSAPPLPPAMVSSALRNRDTSLPKMFDPNYHPRAAVKPETEDPAGSVGSGY